MTDNISTLKKTFKDVVNSVEGDFYIDANFFYHRELNIVLDNVNVEISKDEDKGAKLRVWDGEKFIEGGTSKLDAKSLMALKDELVESAIRNREEISKFSSISVSQEEVKKDFICKQNVSFDSVTLEEKTNKLKLLRDKILGLDKDVVNVRVILFEELEENIFTSRIKQLYQKIPLGIVVMAAFVNCNGTTKMAYHSVVDNDLNVFDKAVNSFEKYKEQIRNLKKAKRLKGGKYKVILCPKLTGLLAHESFGHGMEADTMMKDRALANEWLGKRIGPNNVSIVDYPDIEGKHGQFYFDHEGNLAKKTYLVKNGVINEPMSDIYSRMRLNLNSSSNARMESFDHKHYTRMSNTYFEPGNDTFEKMVASVKEGIFIDGTAGGMEDPKGWGVQIQECFGQRIKNGKLVDEFYDGFALTGFLPDIISKISKVSKEFEIEGGGRCGKGHKEWVRVSEGGPYLLIDEVILG